MNPRITYTRLSRWFYGKPDGVALTANWILIHPTRKGDAALIAHEQEHAEQIAEAGGWLFFWPRYIFSARFRLAAETAAYRVQLEHQVKAHGEQWREEYLVRYSRRLAQSYRLGITPEQARALLLT
jgi:hypothetical protein